MFFSDTYECVLLFPKGAIHYDLGQRISSKATLRQADELFVAAERAGSVKSFTNLARFTCVRIT